MQRLQTDLTAATEKMAALESRFNMKTDECRHLEVNLFTINMYCSFIHYIPVWLFFIIILHNVFTFFIQVFPFPSVFPVVKEYFIYLLLHLFIITIVIMKFI